MQHALIIQTAFIGDVILASPLIEGLHHLFPEAKIDFLLRKGNQGLLEGHPYINEVLIWDKKQHKQRNLRQLVRTIRSKKYDAVINLQRFLSSGIYTAFSKAKMRIGFDKNPLSSFFTHAYPHIIEEGTHEVQRNLSLLQHWDPQLDFKPRLYPSTKHFEEVSSYQSKPYVCMAPTSVWFTKQFPASQWVTLIQRIPKNLPIYLLGGPGDTAACETIIQALPSHRPEIKNLAGKLSFLSSCALMKDASMNYVNDSAPMHMASAMNAPTTAIFCSTIPDFGFGPLSDKSFVVEQKGILECRPCNLHGLKECPEGHFKCALDIEVEKMPLP